ncbi:MAG: Dabb family protein [Verrucomicrobia bacterium]|nr:Dabb family protein [Verrucomicrobiota bacterium]
MLFCALPLQGAQAGKPQKQGRVAGSAQRARKPAQGKGRVIHFVCFKFKESATREQIRKVRDDFRALKRKIPQIVSLRWGTNISPEKLNKGFTHAFLLVFQSEKDRDAYLVHPAHKAFAGSLNGLIDDVFVIDFRPQR